MENVLVVGPLLAGFQEAEPIQRVVFVSEWIVLPVIFPKAKRANEVVSVAVMNRIVTDGTLVEIELLRSRTPGSRFRGYVDWGFLLLFCVANGAASLLFVL
jgi:hypothetical protein